MPVRVQFINIIMQISVSNNQPSDSLAYCKKIYNFAGLKTELPSGSCLNMRTKKNFLLGTTDARVSVPLFLLGHFQTNE